MTVCWWTEWARQREGGRARAKREGACQLVVREAEGSRCSQWRCGNRLSTGGFYRAHLPSLPQLPKPPGGFTFPATRPMPHTNQRPWQRPGCIRHMGTDGESALMQVTYWPCKAWGRRKIERRKCRERAPISSIKAIYYHLELLHRPAGRQPKWWLLLHPASAVTWASNDTGSFMWCPWSVSQAAPPPTNLLSTIGREFQIGIEPGPEHRMGTSNQTACTDTGIIWQNGDWGPSHLGAKWKLGPQSSVSSWVAMEQLAGRQDPWVLICALSLYNAK